MQQDTDELAFLEAGVAAHNAGDLEKAEEFYRKTLAINPFNPDGLHLLGFLAYQAGYSEQAISLIEDAIQIDPTKPLFFNNIASVYKSLGDEGKMINAYRQSIRLKGNDPDVLNDFGNLLFESDQFKADDKIKKEAEKVIRKAIKLNSANAKYHNNLGNVLRYMNPPRLVEAKESFQRALNLDPDLAGAITNLGLVAESEGESVLAEELFKKALDVNPGIAETHNNYAQFLMKKKKYAEAIPHFEIAERLSPRNYTIGLNKAQCLMGLCRDEEALEALHKLMEIDQNRVDAFRNFAVSLRKLYRLNEAQDFVTEALKHFPGDIHLRHQSASIHVAAFEMKQAEKILLELIDELGEALLAVGGGGVYATLGVVYLEIGTVEQVMDMFHKAMHVQPDDMTARNNYALALLATGQLAEGWKYYKTRWLAEDFTSPVRPFQKPVWEGQPLEGKTIALWGEQGMGDELRYASLIPEMMDKKANIVIECDPRLVELYERSFEGAKVYGRKGDLSVPYEDTCDYQIPIIDLAGFFRPTLESFPPRPNPYLKPDPDRKEFWRQRLAALGSRPKIGVVWRSMLIDDSRMTHYMKIEQLEPILTIQGVDFINLMYAECSEERALAADRFGANIHTWDDINLKDDQDDLAALIANLDLVVTPWTAVSALAAALDVSVDVFSTVKRFPELLGDPSAPGWGPSMTYFFKKLDEEWDQVAIDIAGDIKSRFGLG